MDARREVSIRQRLLVAPLAALAGMRTCQRSRRTRACVDALQRARLAVIAEHAEAGLGSPGDCGRDALAGGTPRPEFVTTAANIIADDMDDMDMEDDMDKAEEHEDNGEGRKRRSPLRQADVPGRSLKEALRVPEALRDHFAGKSARPLQVASAINMQPGSGPFRTLTGAAEAYGLTSGASRSEEISLTDLGRRIVSPREEGADVLGMREASSSLA